MPQVDDFDLERAIAISGGRQAGPPDQAQPAQPLGGGAGPVWDEPGPRATSRRPHAGSARSGRTPAPAGDLRAAFLRGAGIEGAAGAADDAAAEMERFGREYRLMMDGLMQLLRKRAEEKGSARVAQTVVGSSMVNPLKFLPTVDDAMATLIADRSPGFLAADAAIADAVRDLAQHHVRAWRGVQGALRRMIDRFDPAAIEEELKSSSALGYAAFRRPERQALGALPQAAQRYCSKRGVRGSWESSALISATHMRRNSLMQRRQFLLVSGWGALLPPARADRRNPRPLSSTSPARKA